MSDIVAYAVHAGIAEVVIDNPPVNATSYGVRAGLADALLRFEADEQALAMVIRCAGRTFVAGADIKEFGRPMAPPMLPEVLASMDRAIKPIIAAVHGTVLGGGFEVALAAHYRIATPDARFGFPEVKLGLLPGGGGTQRTPRLAGLGVAIRLVTEGQQIGAAEALEHGLIDAVADGDLAIAAHRFASRLVADGKGPRSAGELPMPADDPALFDQARKTLGRKMRGQTAPIEALAAIRLGYDHDFATALEREYALCKTAIAGPQSKALRHVFAAEREVARVAGLPNDVAERPIGRAGVVGLGAMGRGIVMAIAAAGIPVTAVAEDQPHLDAAMRAIAKIWGSAVAKGSLAQADMDRRMGLITASADPSDLADADLVIEAVTEDIAIKREIFERLGSVTRPGAILASNTSFLNIDALAQASGRPEDVCGMHFFNPAHIMRLLENVRGAHTHPDVIATIMGFGKRIGKLSVLSGACEGFIVNRMLAKRSREGFFLVEEGASPEAIDAVLLAYGFPMGPFALGDLAGLDVQAAARQSRRASATPRELRANFVEQMVAAGRVGQKSGSGWYLYDENRRPERAAPAVRGRDPRTSALRHGQRGREDPRRRDRAAPAGDRRRADQWSRLAGLYGRAAVLGRSNRARQGAGVDRTVSRRTGRCLLDAGCPACPIRRRRPGVLRMTTGFEHSPRTADLLERLRAFMAQHIYPHEKLYYAQIEEGGRWTKVAIVEDLKPRAREAGLWNLFLPHSEAGAGLGNLEYAPLCEEMGRVHWSSTVFNCAAPDTGNMETLERFGTAEHKARWLRPLLDGDIRSAFAMTEPAVASSDATNIETSIVRDGDDYVINGRKWWISGVGEPNCEIMILLGKTDPQAPKHRQQSMILVPRDTPGVTVVRPMTVFGYDDAPHGHMEILFENVRVPAGNLLLGEGRGFEIAQARLGPGRIHHCMRQIGMAERALEAMCRRVKSRVAFGKPLAQQGVIVERIANARISIDQARLLTLNAAHRMDVVGNKAARAEIAMIKVVAPSMACQVIDWAIQAHGAMGLSQDSFLAHYYVHARKLRFADGPDEVHRHQLGTLELAKYS